MAKKESKQHTSPKEEKGYVPEVCSNKYPSIGYAIDELGPDHPSMKERGAAIHKSIEDSILNRRVAREALERGLGGRE